MGWMQHLYRVLLILNLLRFVFTCSVFTNPFGNITDDQYLEVGSPLRIQCSLFENAAKKNNASAQNLLLSLRGRKLPTKIIDKLTIEYFLPSATVNDTETYNCYVELPDYNSPQLVCNTFVTVGYKPLPVENFTCISEKFENLTCSWKPPYNPIRTVYELQDFLLNDPRFNRSCPVPKETSCLFGLKTSPHYIQRQDVLNFLLVGSNELGSNTQHISIDHYSIVKPGPPKFMICSNVTQSSLFMRWDPPMWLGHGRSPRRLIYQLRYYSVSTNLKEVTEIEKISSDDLRININNLVPNTIYEFKIRVRLNVSGDDYYWSDFATYSEKTKPDVPYLAPETTRSAFDVQIIAGNRSVTLYWKAIPSEFENGEDFHYAVRYHEHYVPFRFRRDLSSNKKPNYWASLLNKTSHTFEYLDPNSAYIFNIYAVNREGNSTNETAVIVDKMERMLQGPKDIMVVSYGEGNYSISWKDPNREVTHYTLLWCKTLKSRPAKCDGPIAWRHIIKTQTHHQLLLPDHYTNYQFAVAANFNHQTSGMFWAPCIAAYGVRYKVNELNLVPKNSTSLRLQWLLGCKAQEKVIKKYLISYCAYEGKCVDSENWKCEAGWSNVTLLDPSRNEFILTGLKPFTCYISFMRVFTDTGWSENSDFTYEATMPSAPGDPPRNVAAALLPVNPYTVEIELVFDPPTTPNGIITKYKIYYNDTSAEEENFQMEVSSEEMHVRIKNYVYYNKNYSVEVAACVYQACSETSQPLYIYTGISNPSVVKAPRIELFESTVNISWEPPHLPNGPIDFYEVELYSNSSDKSDHFFVNASSSLTLERECDSVDPDESVYNFRVRAVNIEGERFLYGEYSLPTKMVFCPSGKSVGSLIAAILGALVALLIGIGVVAYSLHKCRGEILARKNLNIKLPMELETPFGVSNPLNSFDKLKNGLQKTAPDASIPCDQAYERLCSFAQEANQSEPREWSEKDSSHRNHSGESNKSGISSADTTRTIVSMDSSGEQEFSAGESPDPTRSNAATPKDFDPLANSFTPLFTNNSNNMAFSRCFVRPKAPVQPLIRFEDIGILQPYCKFNEIPAMPSKLGDENQYQSQFSASSFLESLYKINSEPSLCGSETDAADFAAPMQPYSKLGLARSNTHLSDYNRPNVGYSRFGTACSPYSRQRNPQIFTVFVPPNPTLKNGDKFPHAQKDTAPSYNPEENFSYSKLGVAPVPPRCKDYVAIGSLNPDTRTFNKAGGANPNSSQQTSPDFEEDDLDDPRSLMEIMASDTRICAPSFELKEIDESHASSNGEQAVACNGTGNSFEENPHAHMNGVANGLCEDYDIEEEEIEPQPSTSSKQANPSSSHYVSINELARRKMISANSISVNNNNVGDTPVASV